MNASTSPGTVPIISALHSCQFGSGFDVSRASYTTLYDTQISIHAPSMTNIRKIGQTMPRNLPSTNCAAADRLRKQRERGAAFDFVGHRNARRPQRRPGSPAP